MIHNINGSSLESLTEQLFRTLWVINDAVDALRSSCPHGRDFQYEAPEDYQNARADWTARLHDLGEIRDSLKADLMELLLTEKIDHSSVRYHRETR